jgi:hypothetical protein
MAYVDFSYYQNNYKGVVIPLDQFDPVAAEASRYIDYRTQDKASENLTKYESQIKNATCAAAEAIYKIKGLEFITTESANGAGASYDVNKINAAKREAIKPYLISTGLLYTGVY